MFTSLGKRQSSPRHYTSGLEFISSISNFDGKWRCHIILVYQDVLSPRPPEFLQEQQLIWKARYGGREVPSLLFPLSLWAGGPDCLDEERCHDDSQWPLEPCNLTCLQEPSPGHNHLVTSKSRLHKVSERCWKREQIWPIFGYLLLSVPLTLS